MELIYQFTILQPEDYYYPVDKIEAALIRRIGKRMKEARELCDLTREQAAKMLKTDAAFLGKFENGVDISSIPLKIIYRASEVFDVSADYLFGGTGDWEKSEDAKFERNVNLWIFEETFAEFSLWAVEQMHQQKRQDVLSKTVVTLLNAVAGINEALHRFREVNPGFDEMRAGSMLLSRVENAAQKAKQAECDLKKCRVTPINEEALA